MSAEADRNLLFGIFAVQMDMLSREELLVGMTAWAARPDWRTRSRKPTAS